MGCYTLTSDFEPTLFLEGEAEKIDTPKWHVWSNPSSTLGEADAKVLNSAGPGDPTYRLVMNTPNVLIFVQSAQATSSLTIERSVGTIFDNNGNIVDQFGQIRITGVSPWQGSPARGMDLSTEIPSDMQDIITGASEYRGNRDYSGESVWSKYWDFITTYDPSPNNLFYTPPPRLNTGAPHR